MAKFICILGVKEGVPFEEVIRPLLVEEERTAWGLYMDGFVREMYLTQQQGVVASVVEAESEDEIRQRFAELPMVKADTLEMQFYELRPFANWEALFAPELTAGAPQS